MSPDGRAIAYQDQIDGHFQIRVISPAGNEPRTLTNDGENEQPAWASDGRHLVFTSTRTGVASLWVVDTESGRMRQLTHQGTAHRGAWSPR